MVKQKE